MCMCRSLSGVLLFAIPWTIVPQASLFTEFSRQEYWSGWPLPSLGDLPDPGIDPRSPALQEDSLPFEPSGKTLLNSDRLRQALQKKESIIYAVPTMCQTLCILYTLSHLIHLKIL